MFPYEYKIENSTIFRGLFPGVEIEDLPDEQENRRGNGTKEDEKERILIFRLVIVS